ncbi:MAG: alternative ribosome rescue aminoacyl-tRNA hydrolase ArfB [Nocardioidaceae bacterium]
MPGPLAIEPGIEIPEHELRWRFSRSSGPGGQSVNTTDSRVELSFDVARTEALDSSLRARALDQLAGRLVDGILTIAASEQRSQLRNREAAEQRLAQLIRAAIAPPPPPRRPTRPTRASVRRRLDAKSQRGERKRLRQDPQDG